MDNDTTDATPPPEPPAASATTPLTLADLMTRLIDAGVAFEFGFMPDEEKPERRFAASVNREAARAADPVTALLEAAARGIRSEEQNADKARKLVAETDAKMVKVNSLLPDLTAHIPAEDGRGRCSCGRRHGPGGMVQVLMERLLGKDAGGVTLVEIGGVAPPEDPKPPKKEN